MLGTYVNTQANRCWPADAELARRRGVSERSIRYSMAKLKRCGYLHRWQRKQNAAITPFCSIASPRLENARASGSFLFHVDVFRLANEPMALLMLSTEAGAQPRAWLTEDGTPIPLAAGARTALGLRRHHLGRLVRRARRCREHPVDGADWRCRASPEAPQPAGSLARHGAAAGRLLDWGALR